jgi:dihydropteroate synthase
MDNMDKDTFFEKKLLINCGGKLLDLSVPRVMGILNITPDSFYDGGKYQNVEAIKERVITMYEEGADIIDLGACSTRPGAMEISEMEEWSRLSKALEIIRNLYSDVIISVDTSRSEIAKESVNRFGVDIINDVTSGNGDNLMFETIAKLQIPYIIMHMQGNPQTMQLKPEYENIIIEIISFLANKSEELKKIGVNDLIVDPGFGFGKTREQNYRILSHFSALKILDLPILAGISRKSMIHKELNISAEESLNGTTVLNTLALDRGATILRVHDVKEAKQTIKLFLKTREEGKNYLQQLSD